MAVIGMRKLIASPVTKKDDSNSKEGVKSACTVGQTIDDEQEEEPNDDALASMLDELENSK